MRYVVFKVEGRPQPKERPRVTKYGTYTPQKTLNYEKAVAYAYKAKSGGMIFDTPVRVDITAFFKIPKNVKKSERAGFENEPYPHRPDLDNIAKSICDGLNGVAYTDDKLITTLIVKKIYGEWEGVAVIVSDEKERGTTNE